MLPEQAPSKAKYAYILIGIAVIAGVYFFYFKKSTPDLAAVTSGLQAYLVSAKANPSCSGTVTLDSFSGVTIGELDKRMGGYPVYANYKKTCKQGKVTSTYTSSNSPAQKVASAYVRYSSNGSLEFFTPAIFEQAGREMQQDFDRQINEAFDNVQF